MTAIGIDLGTTNSVAAVAQEGQEPRILRSTEGKLYTPSAVSFDHGTFLVGGKALDHAIRAPGDTVFSIKRLMGHGRDDDEVVKASAKYPYMITGAFDAKDQGVRVLVNGTRYCPEDISAMILRQIVEAASEELGEKVTHAVITVPAFFSDPQRLATREAGEKAGLTVKRIIDEPTAAALAFGVTRHDEDHQLLVFDMGGGTLDISIGYMADGQFVGELIEGDRWLGGDDLDYEIVALIREWIESHYGVSDLSHDSRFQLMARRKAEEAKCILSEREDVDLLLPAIVPLPHGEVASVSMSLSRSVFEERIEKHVAGSVNKVKQAMARQSLDPDDISKVLLVGGSTRVPAVRRALIELFGEEKVRYEVDPMLAVALGAAILAQHLEGVECPGCKKINPDDARTCEGCSRSLSAARAATGNLGLHEVTERDLGICAFDKEKNDPDVFVPLIKAGTPYPLPEAVGKTFRIGGRKITIPAYVGDQEKASANEYLGVVEFELPSDVPAQNSVVVQFNYDRNRILTIGVEIPGRPDLNLEATPRRQGLAHPGLGDGKWRISLENTMRFVDRVTEDYGEFLDPEKKETVEEEMERARQALLDDDAGAGEQALSGLSHVAQNLGVAGHLFLSRRLSTEADPRTAEQLAGLEKSLREAYRKEDDHGVRQIMRAMEVNFNHIAARSRGADLQDPRDLLEIVKEEGE